MSERNGDKARFNRRRKAKILRRTRIREFRKLPGLACHPLEAKPKEKKTEHEIV